ncbi:ABC transporter ATP-binding protein [Spiroplasma endosymbiont of Panorpa germanica]|uniref:ABC transporter ATP-binding protein n=1 Tax=Spiroplasma endosymbiont of Panorpa germanica TaxID=3066314 RepID=UPI0030D21B93
MKLEIKNLNKSFNNKVALNNINFSLNEGDIIGLIGNNGAGKTTIIKSIFQEYIVDKNCILVNGEMIDENSLKKMEFFPDQNNFSKNFNIKKYCNYNYQLKNGKNGCDFEKLFLKIMSLLGLEDKVKDKFNQLSSGMQKKALLASILVNKPEIIVLDEPTANLDIQTRKQFIGLLKKLSQKSDVGIIITSHNIDELETFINKIVLIKNGEIILQKKYDPNKEKLFDIYKKWFLIDDNNPQESELLEIYSQK